MFDPQWLEDLTEDVTPFIWIAVAGVIACIAVFGFGAWVLLT